MQGRRALIFAGGTWAGPQGPQVHLIEGPWDWVICADSGARHALHLGFHPDLLVGDFDSISERDAASLKDVLRLRFSTDKDQTDTHIAVDWALAQGATQIVVAAGLGTRFDHSLANAHLLVTIHKAATGVITDGRQAIYLLMDTLSLQEPPGTAVSLLPLTPQLQGLTLRGVRWELSDHTVELGETRTVSNEFTHRTAEFTLVQGAALVIVGAFD